MIRTPGRRRRDDWEPPESGTLTCESLRLDLKSARCGRTWMLLPEGFRSREVGKHYPLPNTGKDLQDLAAIYIPPRKLDAGCLYLRRAVEAYRKHQGGRQSALVDIGRRQDAIEGAHKKYTEAVSQMRSEARREIERVREEAARAIASLNDLFVLGREGIEGQMRAHLAGTKWKDEVIDAEAFRQCFRLVSQAVKGLGVSTAPERESAKEAVFAEAAAALRATQEAVAMAPGNNEDGRPQ